MKKMEIAGQDGIIIKDEEEFLTFQEEVLKTIQNRASYSTIQKKVFTDRIKINELLVRPNSYPVILLPHPEADDVGKLPWYFITKENVNEILNVLHKLEDTEDFATSDRFTRER